MGYNVALKSIRAVNNSLLASNPLKELRPPNIEHDRDTWRPG